MMSAANRITGSARRGDRCISLRSTAPYGTGAGAGVRIPSVLTFPSRMEPLAEGCSGREEALDV
ncbi:hypothetical protein [Thioalkalivibrio sp.]|uniref:hypothetical protein n=1 Tax=Thioalkalivibrio sp. TaxID=2093813 RepID=UPI003568867F